MQQMNAEMLRATQQFDDVHVLSPQGDLTARIVFKTVLAFQGGNLLDGQLRALNALTDLAGDVAPHLSHMQCAGDAARIEPFDIDEFYGKSASTIRQLHQNGPYLDGINLGLFGTPFNTPDNTGVTAFGGSVVAGGGLEGTADISILEFSTSLGWDAEDMFRRQIARTIKAASTLQASFGLAGFGLQYDRIYSSTAGSFPYLKRFPGIHCSLDDSFAVEMSVRRAVADRYFSINWLTLLGDTMLAELGIADAAQLSHKLGGECVVHAYDGGLLVQAGPYPQPGDVNQGLVLDDYRRVNEVTRPLRFDDYLVPVINAPAPLDSLAETRAWVSRFD